MLMLCSLFPVQELHGRQCRHPFTERLLTIIPDASVDMQFGTGAQRLELNLLYGWVRGNRMEPLVTFVLNEQCVRVSV